MIYPFNQKNKKNQHNPHGQYPIGVAGERMGLKPVHTARLILKVGVLGLLSLITWAFFAEIEQISRAPGQVIAIAKTQTVQAPDGGVILKILVKEGDNVHKGQILAQLEQARAKAAVNDSQAKVAALKITLLRLQAEVLNRPLVFPYELQQYNAYISNQTDLYKRRQSAINEEVQGLQDNLRLAKEELNMNKPLLEAGDVSRADIIKLERQVTDTQSQITNRKNRYFQDAQTEMTKAQEDLRTQEEALSDRSQTLEHTELLAPVNGIVKNIKQNTEGAVLRAGEELMQLLPTDSDLIVEAKFKPAEIAFIHEGLPATVKLDAYDYSIFGSLTGIVKYMSADTLIEDTRQGEVPYYKVQIKITGHEFKGAKAQYIKVKPGLTASVEIKTGQRTVLWYLLKPFVKTLNEGMHEK